MNTTIRRLMAAIALCALVLAGGCSEKKPFDKPDPFFEKWRVMAKESQGYSPEHDPEHIDMVEAAVKPPAEEEEGDVVVPEELKRLPDTSVTLRFRNTDVRAVLQAMARAEEQSIIISPNVTGRVSVNIKEQPWGKVFNGILRTNGLTYLWEGDILRVVTAQDLETDLTIDEMNKKRLTQSVETEKIEPPMLSLVKLKYAKVEELQEQMQNLLSKDKDGSAIGSVQMNKATNSLIVEAIRSDVEKVINLANRLDKPRRQIHIKAHIVEATDKAARRLGVQWGGVQRWSPSSWNGRTLDLDGQVVFPPNNVDATTGLFDLGVAYQGPGGALELQLKALETDSQLNILSSPSITTLDNQKAITKNGRDIPYQTTEVSGGAVINTIKFVEAVLELEIEPQVIDSETLRLTVRVKKDEPDFSNNVNGNPYIFKKSTETALILKSGETVVISGLSKTTDSDGEKGVPWFKDVPILGWLAKNEDLSDEKEQVLVFVTPTILPERPKGAAQRSLEEIEAELEAKRRAEQDQ